MTVQAVTNPALAPQPEALGSVAPDGRRAGQGNLLVSLVEALRWTRTAFSGLTWLKPPYRSAKTLAAWVYSSWNMSRAGTITRVNVGCGKDVRPQWWNIDFTYFPGVNEIRDATKPWRHRNLDCVFSEHFIEHLDLHQAIDFLIHAGNALRPGGVLRVSTPNLTSVMQQCYNMHAPDLQQRLHDTVDINSCFHAYGHQFLFSSEFLVFLLGELGFQDVHQCGFGESDQPALRGLERHGPYEVIDGVPNLVIAEASRGSAPIARSRKLNAFLDRYFRSDGAYR